MTSTLAPNTKERIKSLDILRGFALLGILIMNIQSLSMPGAAYFNPTAYGDLTGVNKWVYMLSHILADQKFMSIFSILFGAGIILITEKATAKGKHPGKLHYKRNFWLLLIGLCHAYLIWYGDILVTYALVGAIVYLMRNIKAKNQLIIAGILLLVPMAFNFYSAFTLPYWPAEAVEANKVFWNPGQEAIIKEVNTYQSGWLDQMETRIGTAMGLQTFVFLIQFIWRVSAMMLIGMAFYKLGILSAQRSKSTYRQMVAWGLGLGLPLIIIGLVDNFAHDWSMEYSMFIGAEYNYWGSIAVAFGYIGIIMLICQSDGFKRFKSWMAPVGKMALTNYLMQSIICSFIFYGHGLGLYGEVERIGQIGIVLMVWVFQIMLSNYWLQHFQFGPFEWMWRSLTYWRLQPFRK